MSNILVFIIVGIAATTLLIFAILRVIISLHMLQLEGYKTKRFIRWLISNRKRIFGSQAVWTELGVYIRKKDGPKKRLVFTARATRLFILTLLLIYLVIYYLSSLSLYLALPVILLVGFFAPIPILISNILIYPLETMINNIYLLSARRRLRRLNPKVIAITGSYGKTSTKDFLAAILSKRYKVLKTPESFNTPMGICKVIRGDLTAGHKIFIVEMGAREKGDIKELCKLAKPEIGILTAIGPQHLEMFGTIENIIKTKYELIESLPVGAVAIFNNDDENCRRLADSTRDKKVLRYGIGEESGRPYLMAREISMDSEGISFLAENSQGGTVPCHCRLLGRHNVYNILAAATVAREFGISLNEISESIKMLEPIPHRLQLIHGRGGVTVIDDAYNSNPRGARMALEVLGEFKGGRKILVTPGLIELGEREYEENRQLGIEAAKVCDLVFLVGPKRTRPIFEGLKEVNFPQERIFVMRDLNQATEGLKNVVRAGDVVLFENDLPDTYNE